MNSKYLLFFIILFLCGCEGIEKVTDLNYSLYEPKLVIYGFISNTEGVQIQVMKTVPPDCVSDSATVENASVQLYENGVLLCKLVEKEKGFFELPEGYEIRYNKRYYIKAVADGLPEAYSTEQILPDSVLLDSISVSVDTINHTGKFLSFWFFNTAKKSAFYFDIILYDLMGNPLEDNEFYEEIFSPYSVIDNSYFDYEKNVSYALPVYTEGYTDTILITAQLFTLSEDVALYAKSVVEYEYTAEEPIFEQPYPVYTNIKNGFGLFGAYTKIEKIKKVMFKH